MIVNKYFLKFICYFFIIKQRGTVAIPFANPACLSIFLKRKRNSLCSLSQIKIRTTLQNIFAMKVLAKETHKCV